MPDPGSPAPPESARTAGPWRRTLRRLRRRRPVPVGRVPRASQLRMLVAVLDDAVAALSSADLAVAACGAPDGATWQAAQGCGRAARGFHRLRARLDELPISEPDLVDARDDAGRLLAYHQWMVHQAMNLAFTIHPDARTEAARLELNGLGRPADRLRLLRDALDETRAGEPRQG
ncbi:hypothetical protein [Streptomyces sp. NPDC049915]|uniref:hypothetical protein n=1 Tax=Streptomyces sp. NPDC049915 TaxID=3155510 RepID=UPI003424B5FC